MALREAPTAKGKFIDLCGVVETEEELERVAHALGKTVQQGLGTDSQGEGSLGYRPYIFATLSEGPSSLVTVTIGTYVSIYTENPRRSTTVPSGGDTEGSRPSPS